MLFDLGGSTSGVSILDVGDGVREVLSASGDTHLGGGDSGKIVERQAEDIRKREGTDLRRHQPTLFCSGHG